MMNTVNLGVFQPSLEITKALKQRLSKMTPKQLKNLDKNISQQVLPALFTLLPELKGLADKLDINSDRKITKIVSQTDDTTEKALQWWYRNEWFNAPGFERETAAARAFDMLIDLEGYDKNSDEYFSILNTRLRNFFSGERVTRQIKYNG